MILAYRIPGVRGVCVVSIWSFATYMQGLEKVYPVQPEIVAQFKSRGTFIREFEQRYGNKRIKPTWYEDTPEVIAYLQGCAAAQSKPKDRTRRLDSEEALAIFRAAHAPDSPGDEAIGAKYGVSNITVGLIARGQTHKHLFKIERAPMGFPAGSYYVSELAPTAPRYLLRYGERKR